LDRGDGSLELHIGKPRSPDINSLSQLHPGDRRIAALGAADQSPYLAIANTPHGVPSRLVAMHLIPLVRPFVNWFFIMVSRQLTLPAPTGRGFAKRPPVRLIPIWAAEDQPHAMRSKDPKREALPIARDA